MEGGKARATHVAIELDHVTEDALHVQHTLEQVALEFAAVFRCAYLANVAGDVHQNPFRARP